MYTVNLELFCNNFIFANIALKYIFVTLKNRNYIVVYISVDDRVISAFCKDFVLMYFYICQVSQNKILTKISEFTVHISYEGFHGVS